MIPRMVRGLMVSYWNEGPGFDPKKLIEEKTGGHAPKPANEQGSISRDLSDKRPGGVSGETANRTALLSGGRGPTPDRIEKSTGSEFVESAAKEEGAVKTASGLVYIRLRQGNGVTPTATDTVVVNYRGKLTDGKEFDSSYRHGRPSQFALAKVIKCWSEGLQLMKVGGKAKLVCTASVAYGDRGAGNVIPPDTTLIYEVELLGVKKWWQK
jgi:FKBP-type peptidyl-prolyl cis-trans isomerase FkpA